MGWQNRIYFVIERHSTFFTEKEEGSYDSSSYPAGYPNGALALSLAACGGVPRYLNGTASGEIASADSSVPDSPSAFEVLQTANDTMGRVQGLDMEIGFIFRQAMSGRAVESGLDGRLTLEDESHFRLDAVQTALGQEVPLLLYADGEYLYLDASGRKSKLPFGDMADGLLDGETPELKEDDFSWLELSEEGDLHVITGELDTAQAGELMKKLFGSGWMSSPDSLDQTEEGPGMAFQAKALNITVKVGQDNLIREMTASLSMAYAAELPAGSNVESITQTEVTFDISATMQVQNPGAPVTVTPPEDLDAYEDQTAAAGYAA